MKVVLFCGGLGLRLHPSTERMPKPLVKVGGQPVLLHLMKYYSYFGHKDFILCLGYKGEEIKIIFDETNYLSPVYLRKSDAELQFVEKQR